ncbi:MAG: hypothetical protein MUF54_08300 [Polyangiaceae bacterium]|nr:hypothetical protein [Polyangiaceae bacterium]
MSHRLYALTVRLVLLSWLGAVGNACSDNVHSSGDVNRGPIDAGSLDAGSLDADSLDAGSVHVESPAGEPRFAPLVAGHNSCSMVQAYFPKAILTEMLPGHLSIPDDATMTAVYPGTKLEAGKHPFMLSFCHGSQIHDLITETNLPEQEELMFVFPVVYTHDDGNRHLCSYVPVLYLDSQKGVEGGQFYGLRKEYHPEMTHGGNGTASSWWRIDGIIEASFEMQLSEELPGLPNFFGQTMANPFVTISYPPESKTFFYEATVYTSMVTNSTNAFHWNYSGITVQSSEQTSAVYAEYTFTMSFPMTGKEYFASGG